MRSFLVTPPILIRGGALGVWRETRCITKGQLLKLASRGATILVPAGHAAVDALRLLHLLGGDGYTVALSALESGDAQGVVVRYIEVKGRGLEDANEVSLTENEWEAARRLGEQHWLYVVRLGDGMMWLIQNPYAKLQPKELKRWIVKVRDVAEQGETVVLERV